MTSGACALGVRCRVVGEGVDQSTSGVARQGQRADGPADVIGVSGYQTDVLLRPLLVVAFLVAFITTAGSAHAQGDDVLADAGEALRRDPVFVDPAAERALTDAEADRLREEIRASDTPVFVAVLPASAGDADDVVRRLPGVTGLSGTYAAVVGDAFRATSTNVTTADELASAAFQAASSGGTSAVLSRFVDEVRTATPSQPPSAVDPGDRDTRDNNAADGGDDGPGNLLPIALLAGGGVALVLWSRRRRHREAAEQRRRLAADAEIVRAELAVLADDILRLEPEVELHPAARDDYEAAVERHRVASAALDYADEPIDLVRLDRVVSEARYAMARAKAQVAGREPPPPPDELRRPGRHDEPPLDLDGRGELVYAGGMPFYGGGWFGGGGGLFSGLLLGSMLGGWGWGGPVIINEDGGGWDGGDGSGFDGGDLGGGDWGGMGDIGGGDW